MGLKEYFKRSKAEARKTPAQKETDKKIEKTYWTQQKNLRVIVITN